MLRSRSAELKEMIGRGECFFDEDGAAVHDLVRLGLAEWEDGKEASGGESKALRGVPPAPALERLRDHWIDMFPSH